MLKTITGIILLLAPFVFLFKGKDKILSFARVLSFIIILHLLIAVLTQALNVFIYRVVLIVHAIVFIVIIITSGRKKIFSGIKPDIKKIDWVFIFILIVSFINLFSVHFNYSGKYTVAVDPEYREARNMEYSYPYFADEWYAVSLIKDSFKTHSLPFRYSIIQGKPFFFNLEFIFHSFIAELMLLLNLDPLSAISTEKRVS